MLEELTQKTDIANTYLFIYIYIYIHTHTNTYICIHIYTHTKKQCKYITSKHTHIHN